MNESFEYYTKEEIAQIDKCKEKVGDQLEDEEIYEIMLKHNFNDTKVTAEINQIADTLKKRGTEWNTIQNGKKIQQKKSLDEGRPNFDDKKYPKDRDQNYERYNYGRGKDLQRGGRGQRFYKNFDRNNDYYQKRNYYENYNFNNNDERHYNNYYEGKESNINYEKIDSNLKNQNSGENMEVRVDKRGKLNRNDYDGYKRNDEIYNKGEIKTKIKELDSTSNNNIESQEKEQKKQEHGTGSKLENNEPQNQKHIDLECKDKEIKMNENIEGLVSSNELNENTKINKIKVNQQLASENEKKILNTSENYKKPIIQNSQVINDYNITHDQHNQLVHEKVHSAKKNDQYPPWQSSFHNIKCCSNVSDFTIFGQIDHLKQMLYAQCFQNMMPFIGNPNFINPMMNQHEMNQNVNNIDHNMLNLGGIPPMNNMNLNYMNQMGFPNMIGQMNQKNLKMPKQNNFK